MLKKWRCLSPAESSQNQKVVHVKEAYNNLVGFFTGLPLLQEVKLLCMFFFRQKKKKECLNGCITYIVVTTSTQGTRDQPYEPLKPTQAPINPPYKRACELKKSNLLDKASYVGEAETTSCGALVSCPGCHPSDPTQPGHVISSAQELQEDTYTVGPGRSGEDVVILPYSEESHRQSPVVSGELYRSF